MFYLELTVPTPEEFLRLRRNSGMGSRSQDGALIGLGNELFCVVLKLVDSGEIVGMARVVGDGGTVFHICDMAVIKKYQKLGGGSLLMDRVMKFIEDSSPPDSYINLISDVSGFYEKWGFKPTQPASYGMYMKTPE